MSKLTDRYKKISLNEASAGDAVSDVKSEFYKAGVKAFNKGLYQRDNPYTDSKEKSEWDAGWTFTMQKQGTSSGKKLNESKEDLVREILGDIIETKNLKIIDIIADTDATISNFAPTMSFEDILKQEKPYYEKTGMNAFDSGYAGAAKKLNESYEKGSFKGKYKFLNGLDDYQIRELCMLSKTENESPNRTRYDKSVFEGEIDVFANTGDFGINFYTKFTEEQKEDLISCIETYAKQNNLNEADGDPLAEGDSVKILKEGDLKGKTGKVISIADKDEAIKKYVIEIDGKEENMQTGDFYNISESKKLNEANDINKSRLNTLCLAIDDAFSTSNYGVDQMDIRNANYSYRKKVTKFIDEFGLENLCKSLVENGFEQYVEQLKKIDGAGKYGKLNEASPSDAGEIWNKMSDEQKTAWYNKKGIPKLMQDLGDYQNLGQNLMIAIFNDMDSLSESTNLFESKESLTKGDLSRVLSLNAVNGKKFSESDISDDILSTFNSKWSQIYKTNPDFDPFGLDVEPNEVDVFDDFMDLIASLGNSDPKVSLFESKQKLESKKLSVLSKTYESNYLKLNSKAGRDFINLNENLKNVKNKIKNSETITGQKAKFSGTDKNILPF